jgi:hypothetical protein
MTAVIEANRKAAQLPKCREIIGRESVDLFGECQAFVLFNDLNYRPRPVFQSYSACNARLMRLNEQFYRSPAAPQFVLFEFSAPDRKFPPLEDAWLLRDLLINYAPVAVEGRFLLLKIRATDPSRLTLLREGTVRPGQPIDLRDYGTTALWLEISLKSSLAGQLRQFLYRPPVVRLAAWREPGRDQIVRRRAPASMLAAGFLASPLVLNNEDVLKLYQSEEANRPGAYSVELLPGEEHWWQEQVRFRLYRIENQSRAR